MRLITVHSCVKVLSESVAQLPCHLMEQKGEYRNKAIKNSLYRVLHDTPNSWMTSSEFWGMVSAHVAMRGNFYGYKVGLTNRATSAIIPVDPDRVSVAQNDDYSLKYTVKSQNNGPDVEYPQDKIFHVRGLMLKNSIVGVNPIEYARESIGLGLASEQFLSNYFGRGMHPGAVIEHPLALSAPAHANLRKNLIEKYAGLGKSHEMMVIDEGMKINFPEIKLVDAQFLELCKLTVSQIAGLFRVPLMLLQTSDNVTTYASAEQFVLSFVTHTLTPILVNIEKAIYRDLLTVAEKDTHYAKFSMQGLMRGAFKDQMDAFAVGIDKEVYNPNEIREWLELNPYEGGDVYRTRTSSMKPETDNKEAKK
jgi:HK97 family phage portal protein